MPSHLAAITPSSFSQPAFTAAFFENYAPAGAAAAAASHAGASHAAEALDGEAHHGKVLHGAASSAQHAAISYTAEKYKTHAAFCQSADFSRYRQEMRADLDLLIGFCRQHGMQDAAGIARRFNKLFDHRFEQAYFDTHAELVDGAGKCALDSFCALIRDARPSTEMKMEAIRNLSEGVDQCASGAVSNLVFAHRDLLLSCGGLKASLWRIKEALVRDVLLEAVREKFGGRQHYGGNEIHYVNSVWNELAPGLGLAKREDWMAPRLDDIDFLESCLYKVHASMTPGRIACRLAEQCLARFSDGLSTAIGHAPARWGAAATDGFLDRIETIRGELGLNEKQLSLYAFIQPDPDGDQYVLRGDASLVAWRIVDAMRAQRLMEGSPVDRGSWLGMDGARYALLTCGDDLAVRARCADSAADGTARIASIEDAAPAAGAAELDPVTMADLRAWVAAHPGAAKEPPYRIPGTLVRRADAVDIMAMPPEWLGDGQLVPDVFDSMSGPYIQHYLDINLAYFMSDLPEQCRVPLFERVAGSGAAARTLARAWFSDSWRSAGQPAGGTATPGQLLVFRGMSEGNAAVIEMMRELAVDVLPVPSARQLEALNGTVEVRIASILAGLSASRSALHAAMAAGHAPAVAAWHRLLVEPKVFPRVATVLLSLVGAYDSRGFSGLLVALRKGHAEAITRYGALLADPAVLPRIEPHLGGLLSVKRDNVPNEFLHAIYHGRIAAAQAYCEVLIAPAILPRITHALPELLGVKGMQGAVVLAEMMRLGNWSGAEAYCRMLVHPAVLPHIEADLADMIRNVLEVLASKGMAGLAVALRNGQAREIQACHALFCCAGIGACFAPALPMLLGTRMNNGLSALACAIRLGHADAIREYHAFVADPAVLPHIGHLLPGMLFVGDFADDPDLRLVLYHLHTEAASAYHAMWADPAFVPYLAPGFVPPVA